MQGSPLPRVDLLAVSAARPASDRDMPGLPPASRAGGEMGPAWEEKTVVFGAVKLVLFVSVRRRSRETLFRVCGAQAFALPGS